MKSRIFSRGFVSLVVTQFFGAANDNILKGVLTYMVIDGAWTGRLGTGGQGIVGLCFTLPFIVLSGYAGQFADRNSKRYVSVLVKIIEVPVALIGMVGFWTGNLWITLTALVALTCQSSFFGPAKYGMIPELVDTGDLSRANGTINMMTNIAVIVGTLVAGVVSDVYDPQPLADGSVPPGLPWVPGVTMVVIAGAGLGAVLFMPRLVPGDRHLRYTLNPFATYWSACREMATSPLLIVALAWGYFYFLAGIALLIIPEYTLVLGISRGAASTLLGIIAVAIGVGSVTAGLVSGRHIEPRLIPIGSIGMTLFFALLGIVPASFTNVAVFVFCTGFFAGFYIIPLQAYLQKLSPDDERGRFLGTANAISFGFLSMSSLLYWIIRPWFGSAPERMFLLSAALMAVGAGAFVLLLRRSAFREEGEVAP